MADNNNKKKGQQSQKQQNPKQNKQTEKVEQPQAEASPAPAQPAVAPVVQQVPQDDQNAATNANKEAVRKEKKQPFQREQGRGVVKAVSSGDSILVVVHNPSKAKQGPPEGMHPITASTLVL
jgi:hypothetical protein